MKQKLNIEIEEHELDRILFLKSKIIVSPQDLAEIGDIIVSAIRRQSK
jgi:hypothetical protein